MKQKPLTDEDPMPFGKYRGKPMKDVPASYLHWLWHEGLTDRRLITYIHDNWQALVDETSNLIWEDYQNE